MERKKFKKKICHNWFTDRTTISVTDKIRIKLENFKLEPGETVSSVIGRLLEIAESWRPK